MKFVSGILATAVLILAESGFAQSFQNLGFESANLANLAAGQYGSFVSSINALPSWSPNLAVMQNNATLGTAGISILTPHWTASMGSGLIGGIIEGNYSAVLQAGQDPNSLTPSFIDASISQSGVFPANAQSLWVKVFGGALSVSFGGQNLLLIALSSNPNYTLYGADISQYAGQTGALAFTASANPSHFNTVELDSIVFSTQSIPEPSGSALFGLGTLLFGLFRPRNSS